MRAGLYRSLTRACSTASLVDGKLEQFTRTRPSPISIAEFIGTQKQLKLSICINLHGDGQSLG